MERMKPFLLLVLALAFCAGGCKRPVPGEMTDARDNQVYQTVTLGDQTWLAKNLNYETANSWCYQDKSENCDTYGRLYTWEAAQTACPADWHLASDQEWRALVHYLDPLADPNDEFTISKIAGGMMKTTGTIEEGTGLWYSPNTGATNKSGFSALPSGTRKPPTDTNLNPSYKMLGYHIMLWTSTGYDDTHAWTMMLDGGQGGVFRDNMAVTTDYGLAVRCIKD